MHSDEQIVVSSCPDAEELRMVVATSFAAVEEAALRGQSRASFHGFLVSATRLPCQGERCIVRVKLVVRLDGHIVNSQTAEIMPALFESAGLIACGRRSAAHARVQN